MKLWDVFSILWLVAATPVLTLTIWFEKTFERCFRLRFPRSEAEVVSHPEHFMRLLQCEGAVPSSAKLVDLQRLAKLESEPDKNATMTIMRLQYTVGAEESVQNIDIFIKFQCSRGLPLLLQGFRAAAEFGIQREVDFYNHLSQAVPMRTPRALFCDSHSLFNRVCIVLEYIPNGITVRDSDGCPESKLAKMVTSAARMHAMFWGKVHSDRATRWIPAARLDHGGMEFVSWVKLLIGKEPEWYRDVFAACVKRLDSVPKTLLHGDCRPGNMQFVSRSDCSRGAKLASGVGVHETDLGVRRSKRVADKIAAAAAAAAAEEHDGDDDCECVFTDFEATNVGPALWDFTYCVVLGQAPDERLKNEDALLSRYVNELTTACGPLEWVDGTVVNVAACNVQYRLLSVVLMILGTAIVRGGQWDGQGNTREDGEAWFLRISRAVLDIEPSLLSSELGLSPDIVLLLRQRAQEQVAEVS